MSLAGSWRSVTIDCEFGKSRAAGTLRRPPDADLLDILGNDRADKIADDGRALQTVDMDAEA